MNTRIGVLSALAAVLLSACPRTDPVPGLPHPPAILSFSADKVRTGPGESVTLSFKTRDAASVVLLDQLGQEVETSGTAAEGQAVVSPLETSFYVLKATSEGGRDSAFVQVSVGEDLAAISLVAIPPEVEAGQEVDLIWTAFNARTASLKDSTGAPLAIDASAGSGMVAVTPSRTETWTLTAAGVDAANVLTATATVKVQPVVQSFAAAPHAALPGDSVTLSWRTRGASEVLIEEQTFGVLLQTSEAGQVESGEFAWTIPEKLPGGALTSEGMPLEFTLTVKQSDPEWTLTRTVRGYVGTGPEIELDVSDAVTLGYPLEVAWNTENAVRVQLLVDGLTVYEPRPGNLAAVVEGEYRIVGLERDSVIELVAHDYTGGTTTARQLVKVVNPPVVDSFTATTPVASPTTGTTVNWTTFDATEVVIRASRGPVLFATRDPARISSGQAKLYIGQNTELVLEAWNDAGQHDEEKRLVELNTPPRVTVAPSPALVGEDVTLTWSVDVSSTAGVFGLPSPTPSPSTVGNVFIDLEASARTRTLRFADADNSVARLRTRIPFRFPFMGSVQESFYVSTNGFLTFERTDSYAGNLDLASTDASLPAILAPFWDDLRLGSGEVLYAILGDSFPRVLVVQWNDVATVDEESALTFQVQLEETGVIRFAYRDLTGIDSGGENASIGVRHAPGSFAVSHSHDSGTQVLTPGLSLTWFDLGDLSGSRAFRTQRSSNYTFFTRTQGLQYVLHAAHVEAFGPGTVVVNEVMPVSATQNPAGRWIELANLTSQDVNLGGLTLRTQTAAEPWLLPSLVIPANGYLILGDSLDPVDNDGANVQHVYAGLPFEPIDSVELALGTQPLSTLSWNAPTAGTSVISPESAIDSTGAVMSCPRTKTFGTMSTGSPGKANEACFEYEVMSIRGAFEDISATGTVRPTSPSYGTIELDVPFTYFGESFEAVHYSSTAGFLSFGPPLTTTSTTNKTVPNTSTPRATVAPFWDSLARNTNGNMYVARRSNYTVISWNDYKISSATNSALNFQVKLFDDGVIEFHYADMIPTTSTSSTYVDRESGKSATTWLERPDGSAALPVNINTAGVIQPHSGYRFTPRQ